MSAKRHNMLFETIFEVILYFIGSSSIVVSNTQYFVVY